MNADLFIHPDGVIRGVYSEAIRLDTLGPLEVQRATRIEFDNQRQAWRVFDPEGFGLFCAPSRQACLDWEHRYLTGLLAREGE